MRKYFRSYLGDADLAEHLMGHSTMLTKAYRKKTIEDLSKEYLNHMANVTFFSFFPDLSGLREDAAEKDRKIKELESKMQQMMIDMQHLLIENDRKNKNK